MELPRDKEGNIISSSNEIKKLALALKEKVGYGLLDARKALLKTDGDLIKAEAILISTEGFKSSKLVTYK
jgi:translation elongation factor EF-Ts